MIHLGVYNRRLAFTVVNGFAKLKGYSLSNFASFVGFDLEPDGEFVLHLNKTPRIDYAMSKRWTKRNVLSSFKVLLQNLINDLKNTKDGEHDFEEYDGPFDIPFNRDTLNDVKNSIFFNMYVPKDKPYTDEEEIKMLKSFLNFLKKRPDRRVNEVIGVPFDPLKATAIKHLAENYIESKNKMSMDVSAARTRFDVTYSNFLYSDEYQDAVRKGKKRCDIEEEKLNQLNDEMLLRLDEIRENFQKKCENDWKKVGLPLY